MDLISVTSRLTPELHKKIKLLADREKRSFSKQIVILLEKAVKK